MFDIHTALKQLDVTLKQVKKTRAQLPKLNREKVDQELKILLLVSQSRSEKAISKYSLVVLYFFFGMVSHVN